MDHARTSYFNKVYFRTEAGAEGMAGKKAIFPQHLLWDSGSCGCSRTMVRRHREWINVNSKVNLKSVE